MQTLEDQSQAPGQLPMLAILRLTWGGMLIGKLLFAGIIITLVRNRQFTPLINPRQARLGFYILLGLLCFCILVAYFLRSQIYKRHWQEHAITARGYFVANLVVWLTIEAFFFLAVIMMFLTGQLFPGFWPALGGLLAMLVTFPTGKPLQPHPPQFGSGLERR